MPQLGPHRRKTLRPEGDLALAIKGVRKILLCFWCLFAAQPAYAQTLDEQLEQTALQEMKRTSTPGVAIALVKDDRIIFSKAFGIANLETDENSNRFGDGRSGYWF